MAVEYINIWGKDEEGNFGETGQVNLCVVGDLVETDLREIVTGEYDELHLQFGNFELMHRVVTESEFSPKRLAVKGDGNVQDVSWISQCTDLEYLYLAVKSKGRIEFANLEKLKDIGAIIWSEAAKDLLTEATGLQRLFLSSFKRPLSDFSPIVAGSIEDFTVQHGSMADLAGIEKFVSLAKLGLLQLRQLRSIELLIDRKNLEELTISGCNKVETVEVLKELVNLTYIDFGNKSLPSLSLLPKENLERVWLGDSTTILDGDVEALLEFPKLYQAGFSKRREYKYGAVEIKAMLDARDRA